MRILYLGFGDALNGLGVFLLILGLINVSLLTLALIWRWSLTETLIYWPSWPKIRRNRKMRFPGSFIFFGLMAVEDGGTPVCRGKRK